MDWRNLRLHRDDCDRRGPARRPWRRRCARPGVDLARAIGSAGRGAGAGSPGRRLTNALVVTQVAVSMLLLVCAGLFVQSSRNADATDFGFRTDDLLVLSVESARAGVPPGSGSCPVSGDRRRGRRPARRPVGELGAPGAGEAGRDLGQGVHPGRRHRRRSPTRRGSPGTTSTPASSTPWASRYSRAAVSARKMERTTGG